MSGTPGDFSAEARGRDAGGPRGDAAADRGRDNRDAPESPPPILSTWRNLYMLVLGELAALVALFYALTRWAS